MNINLASTSNQIPITVNDTGATEYSYSRFITRLSSQKLDVLRMRQSWQAKQQAENAVKQLVRAVGNTWSRFYRQSYINIASYKLIPTKAGVVGLDVVSNDINSMPEVKPEAALNDDLMNQAWQLLINEGAGESAALMDQGSPVFLAYTSKDTVDFHPASQRSYPQGLELRRGRGRQGCYPPASAGREVDVQGLYLHRGQHEPPLHLRRQQADWSEVGGSSPVYQGGNDCW